MGCLAQGLIELVWWVLELVGWVMDALPPLWRGVKRLLVFLGLIGDPRYPPRGPDDRGERA